MKENNNKSQIVSNKFDDIMEFMLNNISRENSYGNFNGVIIIGENRKPFVTGDCFFLDDSESGGNGVIKIRANLINTQGIITDTYIQFVPITINHDDPNLLLCRMFFNDILFGKFENEISDKATIIYRFDSFEDYYKFMVSDDGRHEEIIFSDLYTKKDLEIHLDTAIKGDYNNVSITYIFDNFMYDLIFDIKIYHVFEIYFFVTKVSSNDGVISSIFSSIKSVDGSKPYIKGDTKRTTILGLAENIDSILNSYLNDIIHDKDMCYNVRFRMWKGKEKLHERDGKENKT